MALRTSLRSWQGTSQACHRSVFGQDGIVQGLTGSARPSLILRATITWPWHYKLAGSVCSVL